MVYVDVNKTLVLIDPASKASLSDVCVGCVAENAWGSVGPGEEWNLIDDLLSVDPPSEDENARVYDSFLKNVLHSYDKSQVQGSDEAAAALSANETKKGMVRTKLRSFTDKGQPGEAIAAHHDLLMGTMRLTSAEREAAASSEVEHLFAAGHRFLLPAYFTMLENLIRTSRHFVVVFRTFGHDLGRVVEEHNAWCDGRHPHFRPPAGFDTTALRVRCPQDTGSFVRFGDHSAGIHLAAVAGAVTQSRVVHITGFRDIHDWITASLRDAGAADKKPLNDEDGASGRGAEPAGRVLALTDCYEWWWSNHERGRAGKLMPFDPSDASQLHVFLDDNIGRRRDAVRILRPEHIEAASARADAMKERAEAGLPGAASLRIALSSRAASEATWARSEGEPEVDARIVDARHIHTGQHLSYSELRNVHLVRVDPLSAALNPDYFVECLSMCERNWLEQQARRAALSTPHGAVS